MTIQSLEMCMEKSVRYYYDPRRIEWLNVSILGNDDSTEIWMSLQ